MAFFFDSLIVTPADIDLARSPLAGSIADETYVLGAFNPGLTRLANGNLLLMVRVAEALREPVKDGQARSIRWSPSGYVIDSWPVDAVDTGDPRAFKVDSVNHNVIALTSLSWLLPVELDALGTRIEAIHYDRALAPQASYQSAGIEDARISKVGDRWLMTVCAVSPERLATALYSSTTALDWTLEGLVLDHQNKDMLLFSGLIDGKYWAQTRPIGDTWIAYPPTSDWRAGPAINLASSPDALHWRPCAEPGLRPHAATRATARMGGGAPPIRTPEGWLSLWHGVEPNGGVGTYRTYWSLLDGDAPWRCLRTDHAPLIEPAPALTRDLAAAMYLDDIVFTTGAVDAGDHVVVASGEADLACRITRIPKSAFGLSRLA